MSQDGDEFVLDLAEQTNRPADVAIQQQRIQAWHPILDPEWCIYCFLILALIMIPVGMYSISYSWQQVNNPKLTQSRHLVCLRRLQPGVHVR